jgi:hypothetical protein
MISLTDDGLCSRGLGSDKSVDGRVVAFPSTTPNELRVTVYDPLRGVPVVGLKVRKSYATGKHFIYAKLMTVVVTSKKQLVSLVV